MKPLVISILLMFLAGCGNTYHLRSGGWTLSKTGEGTCLVVHGDGDPEVTRVCIAAPQPLKVSSSIIKEMCRGTQ